MDFAVPVDSRVKLKESEKKREVSRPCQRTEKIVEHESNGDINCNWHARHGYQRIDTSTGGLGNKMTSGDYQNDRILRGVQ